jgi:flagellin
MVGGLDLTSRRVGNFYNASRNALALSLQRISSGKKLVAPRDGVSEFMQVQKIRQDRRGYEEVQKELSYARGMLDIASEAGDHIVKDFRRLKEIYAVYQDETDPTARAALEVEFDTIKSDIDSIMDSTFYDGRQLIQNGSTLKSVMLDPNDLTRTLEITFSGVDLPDTSAFSLSDPQSDLDEQYGNALGYLARVNGYNRSVDAQSAVASSIMENAAAHESTLTDVDDAEEYSRMVTNEIRQQASLAMLSQSNMYRMGVLRLLE